MRGTPRLAEWECSLGSELNTGLPLRPHRSRYPAALVILDKKDIIGIDVEHNIERAGDPLG